MWRPDLFVLLIGLLVGFASDLGIFGPARAESGPVGVWERTLRNDAGPDPLIVMELRADGTYSMSGVPFVEDQGSYSVQNGIISFLSNISPAHNRILALKMEGGSTLSLFTTIPLPYLEVWTRKEGGTFNFRTVNLNGASIPEALPLLMATALASEARPWREDALPTWVRVERMISGDYQVAFHFFSPSATQEMRITVTKHGLKRSVHDGSRSLSAPLPLIFTDLPRIVSAAQAEGFHGALKKADVSVYEGHGAAWMARFDGAHTGATFSAETGERIQGDVTGYVAQYETDWQRATEIWQSVWEQHMPNQGDDCYHCNFMADKALCDYACSLSEPDICVMSGGSWGYDSEYTVTRCR